ncbi:MAG TPA: peptidase M16 [Bacteroidales bacterium]|nr:peptidase M16 [Bacteroidales bacterium]
MVETKVLGNGIRIVHYKTTSPVSHLAIMTETGSRDELIEESGMAHFIEHNLFKGTKKRKIHHILNRLEDVGGDLNAYTTKEETCLHATFLTEYLDRAAELLKDMFFDSTFPEREIEKEKEVILDEINSYLDSPSEQIYDEFDELIYPNHSIGRPILGLAETVKCFNRETVLKFIGSHYATNQIVVATSGSITHEKSFRILQKYFESVPAKFIATTEKEIPIFTANYKAVEKKTYQAHCIIGMPAYEAQHPGRYSLRLLNNVLGGQSMNSRLNMSLREKAGYVYNIDSSYSAFRDAGSLIIYFGTDKENLNRSLDLMYKEVRKLKTVALTKSQMDKAKKQMIGQIAISSESVEAFMLAGARTFLFYNELIMLEKYFQEINKLTADDLIRTANEIFDESKMATLIYK